MITDNILKVYETWIAHGDSGIIQEGVLILPSPSQSTSPSPPSRDHPHSIPSPHPYIFHTTYTPSSSSAPSKPPSFPHPSQPVGTSSTYQGSILSSSLPHYLHICASLTARHSSIEERRLLRRPAEWTKMLFLDVARSGIWVGGIEGVLAGEDGEMDMETGMEMEERETGEVMRERKERNSNKGASTDDQRMRRSERKFNGERRRTRVACMSDRNGESNVMMIGRLRSRLGTEAGSGRESEVGTQRQREMGTRGMDLGDRERTIRRPGIQRYVLRPRRAMGGDCLRVRLHVRMGGGRGRGRGRGRGKAITKSKGSRNLKTKMRFGL